MRFPNRLVAKIASVVFLLACSMFSSSAAIMMPAGAVLQDMCDRSLACSVLDKTWPSEKNFSCGSKSVSSTAVKTATEALTVGKPRKITGDATWPSSASTGCGPLRPGYTRHSYANGIWTLYYTVQSICKCRTLHENSDYIPICRSATSQDMSACNLAIFNFCSMEMDGTTCT